MSFTYGNVKVVRVIDGDTARLSIDMGNKITWCENFRLNGIDAADEDKAKKDAATAHLTAILAAGVSRVETFKPDKFGRWLANIYVPSHGGDMLVNQMMINEGFAVAYSGGRKTQ